MIEGEDPRIPANPGFYIDSENDVWVRSQARFWVVGDPFMDAEPEWLEHEPFERMQRRSEVIQESLEAVKMLLPPNRRFLLLAIEKELMDRDA